MTWEPISLERLQAIIARDLASCSPELRASFEYSALPPEKWRQAPWGEEGGGFWVVATLDGRVLWYNDIEDGFNVSAFSHWGEIPADEYWCNQNPLPLALRELVGKQRGQLGPQQPTKGS